MNVQGANTIIHCFEAQKRRISGAADCRAFRQGISIGSSSRLPAVKWDKSRRARRFCKTNLNQDLVRHKEKCVSPSDNKDVVKFQGSMKEHDSSGCGWTTRPVVNAMTVLSCRISPEFKN